MNTAMIPLRYAKALYEFAVEQSVADRVYGEMQLLAGVSVQNRHCDVHWRIQS